jgi:dynamin GTPase
MLLEQFGTDMSVYTRMVCDTVCITVPKAIVHCMVSLIQSRRCALTFTLISESLPNGHPPPLCSTYPTLPPPQIKKSEKNLLERLFSVIHSLTPVQMENLLREDDSVVQHRLQARKALNELKSAQYQVWYQSTHRWWTPHTHVVSARIHTGIFLLTRMRFPLEFCILNLSYLVVLRIC